MQQVQIKVSQLRINTSDLGLVEEGRVLERSSFDDATVTVGSVDGIKGSVLGVRFEDATINVALSQESTEVLREAMRRAVMAMRHCAACVPAGRSESGRFDTPAVISLLRDGRAPMVSSDGSLRATIVSDNVCLEARLGDGRPAVGVTVEYLGALMVEMALGSIVSKDEDDDDGFVVPDRPARPFLKPDVRSGLIHGAT
jgi:hypothetical protein